MTAVSGEFRREIDAIGEVFAFLEAFVEGQEIDEKTAFCINLVAEELFTNLVRHNVGGGDEITVTIERRRRNREIGNERTTQAQGRDQFNHREP